MNQNRPTYEELLAEIEKLKRELATLKASGLTMPIEKIEFNSRVNEHEQKRGDYKVIPSEIKHEEKEKDFQLLAEAMPQIVWITTAEGKNIYFNRQWVDYTGLSLEESYGDGWNKPFHPLDKQRAWEAWKNAIINDGTYSVECQLRKYDGSYRWWLIRGVPVHDGECKIIKWIGTCTDIQTMKETELALKTAKWETEKSEEKFRLAFFTNPESITINNIETGAYVSVNYGFSKILEYSESEVIGKTSVELNIWYDPKEREQYVLKLKKEGSLENLEAKFRTKSGKIIDCLVSSTVIELDGVLHTINITRDITFRKTIEQELISAKNKAEEGEETYRILFESINDAVFISEPSEDRKTVKFIKVNDVACKRLGYTQEELLAKSPFEINSERKRPDIPGFISKILEQNQAIIETEHVAKNGRIIPVEISTKVTQFKNRILFHSIARDITERKLNERRIKEKTDEIEAQNEEYQQINEELNQANEELIIAKERAEAGEASLTKKNEELKQTIQQLKDLENRLQFALLAGKLGTWDWDILTGKLIWSDTSKLMSGIPVDSEVNYEIFLNTIIPEDRETISQLVEEALKEKKDYSCEYRVLWPDGTIHWISVMGRGIYDNSGRAVRMIGVGMEITDRKQIELSLSQSHNLMRYIIEHNPGSIAVFDKELKYIYVSQQYLNAYQVDESSIIGKNHHEIFPDLPQKFKDAHFKALQGEIVGADEDPYYRADGSVNWTRWECRPWYEADGTIGGIILYIEQITDRIQQKLEIIAAKEKAEESDRLKTAFLQNMSHEIRTPLNAIMGFSSLLKDNFNDKNKVEKFSDIITQRSNDLLDIINDILDIAKIESGQLPINLEECNLSNLFGELSAFFNEYKGRISKEQIDLRLKVNCSANEAKIVTDKGKLKQILINLITNAFKFTENGKIEVGCNINSENYFHFYVADTGMGIPKDKQTIIFERFFQLNQNPRKNIGGTGLGLPIVKGLVNLLGGKIFLDSEPDKGSTFSFTIPFKQAGEGEQNIHHEFFGSKKLEEKIILIVEDDFYNAEYLKEILSEYKAKVLYAETGEAAVKIAEAQKIDLILMDVRLPGIDGYEATRQILQYNAQMKIISQTAYASSEERQKAINVGCKDYISKPTKKETLLSVINEVFDNKG